MFQMFALSESYWKFDNLFTSGDFPRYAETLTKINYVFNTIFAVFKVLFEYLIFKLCVKVKNNKCIDHRPPDLISPGN